MHVRMMTGQELSYTQLINSARRQPEQTETYVEGTIVGFFTPELFHGIESSRFHIHFTNDDRNFGGHVLDFEIEDAKVEIQNFETFEQHFPINDEIFNKMDIDYKDIEEEFRDAE